MTAKTQLEFRRMVAELNKKAMEDVQLCDVLKALELLAKAAQSWFCKK